MARPLLAASLGASSGLRSSVNAGAHGPARAKVLERTPSASTPPAPAPTPAAWTSEGARLRRAPAARAQATLVQSAGRGRAALPRAVGADQRGEPAHRLPGGRLPERRRVLGAGHRHIHDPRRHVHAPLRLLQRQDRQAHVERSAGAGPRGALDRAHGPAPRRGHLGRPRRPARQGRFALSSA